jgi:flagellar secretion chaperone FliS
MNKQLLRDRYVGDSVATASPARLVTMLYDRLMRDMGGAEAAIVAGDYQSASNQLTHAQEIVIELRSALEVDKWSGGPALASLYAFLLTELIAANVHKDAKKVASCRTIVEPLQDAWHQAAAMMTTTRLATSIQASA